MKTIKTLIATTGTAIALTLTAGLATATAASATPNTGPAGIPGVGCAVEDANGTVTYVPIGTSVGLFHCGSDGEWHFGTVTTDIVKPPTKKLPVRLAAVTRTLAR